jgi:hypothetical protein
VSELHVPYQNDDAATATKSTKEEEKSTKVLCLLFFFVPCVVDDASEFDTKPVTRDIGPDYS